MASVGKNLRSGIDSALGFLGNDFDLATEIKLTPGGEKLETSLYESIRDDLFPENLASRYIGQAKRAEGKRRRASERGFNKAAGSDVMVGNIGQALISEFLSRTRGGLGGIREGGRARGTFARGRLGNLRNFINLQSQTPILNAQSQLLSGELKQAEGARQGAFIGGIAQLAAAGA